MKHRRDMNELRDGAERVEIEWIDSSSNGDWHPEHQALTEFETQDHLLCCSIGYVINETDEKIQLTMSFSTETDGTRNVGNTLTIAKVAIKDVKHLRR